MKTTNHFLLLAISMALALAFSGCTLVNNRYKGSYSSVSHGGQTYRTIKIGTQTWMADNLNYNASGSVCYNNQAGYCETYGRLYNWETAKAACPSGWHLPTDAEWETLTSYVGSNAGIELMQDSCPSNAQIIIVDNTNKSGFAALAGSFGNPDGSFGPGNSFGRPEEGGYYWSATADGANSAWSRKMYCDDSNVHRESINKSNLYSVRCIEDN
jgi:uncharacterized protein (TIGR02145 family)